MNKEYSDSLSPLNIATNFNFILGVFLFGGALIVFILEPNEFIKDIIGGSVFIALIFVLFVGPKIFNNKKSRFEKKNSILKKIDFMGRINGLHGALIRLLIYENGIEIRAFYNRYYIPFDKMKDIEVKNKSLTIQTDLYALQHRIDAFSGEKQFLASIQIIKEKFKSNIRLHATAGQRSPLP